MMQNNSDKYIQVNRDGLFGFNDQAITDAEQGQQLLANLTALEPPVLPAIKTNFEGHEAFVEAFDAPIMVLGVDKVDNEQFSMTCNYDFKMNGLYSQLQLDEWDRFRGYTENHVPFVLTRKAQAQLFDLFDEFDDDSFTISGKQFTPALWLGENPDANDKGFWSKHYAEQDIPWDMGQAQPALVSILPQLKLNKQRVLVLGCGTGHDAALLAQSGHIVTAIDYSEGAIAAAEKQYGHIPNLSFKQGDAFNLPPEFHGSFDLLFEHTLYCAVSPERRNELVKHWLKYLDEGGQLLGVFFVFDKPGGPPFGGSEWELQSRLEDKFQFLYWTRWRQSEERRKGTELVVLGQRK